MHYWFCAMPRNTCGVISLVQQQMKPKCKHGGVNTFVYFARRGEPSGTPTLPMAAIMGGESSPFSGAPARLKHLDSEAILGGKRRADRVDFPFMGDELTT